MKIALLRLESPLLAFGGVMVDAQGVIDALPSASLLVGLLGNALGYRRTDAERLQSLQDRLRYAVRIDRSGSRLLDYQTAELSHAEQGWTTRGRPEGRAGGAGSYAGQHQRYRYFHADAAITVALTMTPPDVAPSIDDLAAALDSPVRPLFIGRKPCVPSGRLMLGVVEAQSLIEAFEHAPVSEDADVPIRCFELSENDDLTRPLLQLHGLRNWRSNVHEGVQHWVESMWSPKG